MSIRYLTTLVMMLTLLPVSAADADKKTASSKEGWAVTPLPAIGYDSDFGFMAGGFVDINCYGGLYPNYKHRICLEALVFSKHASCYMLQYDSKYLIPGIRTNARIYFDNNPLYSFYGFNGFVNEYDASLNLNKDKGIAYYSYDRKFLNARIDLEGELSANLDWMAKVQWWHYWIRELNWKGYDHDNTLFSQYLKSGLIEDSESSGGSVLELQAGLKYDTRDIESAPNRGIYADVTLSAAPDINGSGYDYLKLAAHFRQYISLGTDKIVLAYNLAYQGTLWGNPPFYAQSAIMHFKPSDGLGGATTLRGVLYNRVVGNDYLWGNVELRTRIFDKEIFRRRVCGVITPFFDAGMLTNPFRFDRQATVMYDNQSEENYGSFRSSLLDKACQPHLSYGIGTQLIIDYNFIPTLMFGIPFDSRDGKYGIYMTIDYTF